MRIKRIAAVVAVAGAVVFLGIVATGRDGSTSAKGTYVREHPVAVPADARTVFVSETMPMPSAHARRLSAMLVDGPMPSGPMHAEVLTDTDCAPDAEGISHCRNEVALENGRKLVLRHPHEMSRVPCLAPGETVRLVRA